MINLRYRKKPVEIEGVIFEGIRSVTGSVVFSERPKWLNEEMENDVVFIRHGIVHIRTLEGIMQASEGDIIIQGVQGELYPCKPDIFAATYEKVEGGE